jgi:hypothetical protein
MGLDRSRNEKEFYRAVVGTPFEGEFGERDSARRRGAKFERNILQPPGYARLLREAVAPIVGVPAASLILRDLENEEPGNAPGNRLRRLQLTRAVLRDSLLGGSVTHVIVKPVFVLNTGFAPGDIRHRYVEPDFIIWVPGRSMFVPGDFKSFVVRDGIVPSDKLERVRLQLACDVVALRDEALSLQPGLESRVRSDGYLVFATPYGLTPDEPKLEDLTGAVPTILRAIAAFRQARARILALAQGAPIATTAPDLAINFQEKCVATCLLAEHCKQRLSDAPLVLGNAARDLLGDDLSLSHAMRLVTGAVAPVNDEEARLVASLREAAGLPAVRIRRRA